MTAEKILVVDDEKHIRRLCTEILEKENYDVTALDSGRDALEAIRAESFDLLLTDISMPEMDGLELLQSIKEVHREITTVVMTGFGTVENVVQCLHLGAHGFLIKPFTHKDLIQSVEEALERNRLLHENMRLRLLVPLFEVGKTLLSELHLDALLDQVAEVALKETRSNSASVFLIDRSGEPVLKSRASRGESFQKEVDERIMDSAKQWIMEHRQPWVVGRGVPAQAGQLKESILPDEVSAAIMIPLISKVKVVGILGLCKKDNRGSYPQSEIDLLSVLGGQAAIAIENATLFEEVERKNKDLENFYFESVKALAQAIEEKDSVTGSHGDRLENYALAVADRFGFTDYEKMCLRYASALHDIGKIGVSESVLKKADRLTPQEYDEMKTHPLRGGNILREVKFLNPVIPIIYYHHEQYDGNGYPEGLKGDQIPIGSRIVAVIDAFDAMTSDRPYRKRLPMERAINELKKYSGIQFDPKVVDAFIQVVQQSPHPS